MLDVHTHETARLLPEHGVVFYGNLNRRTRSLQCRIKDLHAAQLVVHAVINAFLQDAATGSHDHRTTRHVECPDRNTVAARGFEPSAKLELIFLTFLQRRGLRAAVQIAEYVFSLVVVIGQRIAVSVESAVQMEFVEQGFTERFYGGKYQSAILRING